MVISMTLNEAIEITNRQIEELKSELKTLETKEYVDAFNLAIDVKKLSVEALQEKLEREKNPPLTLSEITSEQFNMFTGCVFLETPYELRNYGVTWLAYRYKKGETNDT